MKRFFTGLAPAAAFFAVGLFGQHAGHQAAVPAAASDQATSDQAAPSAGGKKMMCEGMMSMDKMDKTEKSTPSAAKSAGADTAALLDQLQTSLTAIEAEQNPETLKQKLAAHAELLQKLKTSLQPPAEPDTPEPHDMSKMKH
jgi:hypothetical protein